MDEPIGAEASAQTTEQLNNDGADSKKERSTIRFPYGDLSDAQRVAQAVHDQGGNVELDRLSTALGHQSKDSGSFSIRLSSAQVFGLIERQGKFYRLTEIGRRIINPDTAASARADAFLRVELYNKIYENYHGQPLPADAGLENFMKSVGVAEKQTGKARQVLKRSAEQAGFFEMGNTKLIKPKVSNGSVGTVSHEPAGQSAQSAVVPPKQLHPAVQGMLAGLPMEGEQWTETKQVEWLAAFGQVLSVFHKVKEVLPNMKTITGDYHGREYQINIKYAEGGSGETANRFIVGASTFVDGRELAFNTDPIWKDCASRHTERTEQALILCVEEYIRLTAK